eukprot:2810475-Amphidinium_carterae.1
MRCLMEHLPLRFRLAVGASAGPEWTLRYTAKAHGISMATLYRNLSGFQGTDQCTTFPASRAHCVTSNSISKL